MKCKCKTCGRTFEAEPEERPAEHRILDGDCRDPDDVARLCCGKVQGTFTSPPYAEQRKQQYGGVPADEYLDWWKALQVNVRGVLKDSGSFFVNIKAHCEDGERLLYVMDLVLAMNRQWGWNFVDEFCWRNTRDGVPGRWRNRLKNAWEPVFHFDLGGSEVRHSAIGHASEHVFTYSAENETAGSGSGLLGAGRASGFRSGDALPSNVIEVAAQAGFEAHSAPFPVGLPDFFIRAFSDVGDTWFDPFLGSATTIVACEQNGRIGFGTELKHEYVAVCLERLSSLGLEPRLADA
jgi:site-specific DNA-methyltransferase (adenine-specific)/site-specific DNA-methyltransferase (cytosine-N4-specific)